ncbi:uncharacterized protein METZ01_LOCUS251331, partial [marine metagenome]
PVAYGKVVINEINYNPLEAGTDTTEFIELYNHSASAVDLSGVKENNAIVFTFPAGASIAAGGYIVLAVDSTKFHNRYGSAPDYEWTSGALGNSGEDIELLDSSGARIDYVDFEDGSSASERAAGWNAATDQGGPTYELINPTSDNSLGTSWRGWGVTGGTPGAANSAQPDLSMGASTTNYQGAGTSSAATFQLNNNGDNGLTVDSVTATVFVAGAGTDYAISDASSSTSLSSAVTVSGGTTSIGGASITLTWGGGTAGSNYNSITLTSPTGTSATVVSTYTSYGVKTVSLSNFNGETGVGTWTLTLSAPYAYISEYSYGGAVSDITLSLQQPGTNPAASWLTGTAPAAAISGGDSGNVSLTFNASSFSSDTSLSATVHVYNNDPQDSTDTFAATMVVRADTAIFDITSSTGIVDFSAGVLGDTIGTKTVTIQNDGGSNLRIDSVR